MPHQKILGRSGESLADSYDVEGSIVKYGELDTETVQAVHEIGAVQFSERLVGMIIEGSSTVSASGNFQASLGGAIANVPMVRIIALQVLVDTAGRIAHAAVNLRGDIRPAAGGPSVAQSIPVWVFDGTNTDTVRCMSDDTLADQNSLRPLSNYTQLPTALIGPTQQIAVDRVHCNGSASAFGAGTVTVTVRAYILFSESQGLSSRGVPIPSW